MSYLEIVIKYVANVIKDVDIVISHTSSPYVMVFNMYTSLQILKQNKTKNKELLLTNVARGNYRNVEYDSEIVKDVKHVIFKLL